MNSELTTQETCAKCTKELEEEYHHCEACIQRFCCDDVMIRNDESGESICIGCFSEIVIDRIDEGEPINQLIPGQYDLYYKAEDVVKHMGYQLVIWNNKNYADEYTFVIGSIRDDEYGYECTMSKHPYGPNGVASTELLGGSPRRVGETVDGLIYYYEEDEDFNQINFSDLPNEATKRNVIEHFLDLVRAKPGLSR